MLTPNIATHGRQARASDERAGSLILDSEVLIALLDEDSNVSSINGAATSLFGADPDAVIGSSFWTLVHADDLARAHEVFGDVAERPRCEARFQCRARDVDGAQRWLEVVLANRLDDVAVGAIVVNARDITVRRETEQSLLAEVRSASFSASIGNALIADEPMDDVLAICAHAALGLGCSAVYIWTVSDDDSAFELRASAPRDAGSVLPSIPIAGASGDWSRAPWMEIGDSSDMRAFAYPLVNGDRLIGSIMALADEPLSQTALRALRLAANQIAIAIGHRQAAVDLSRAMERLAEANEARADLIRHLVLSQEEERRILAADIHDDSIQQMAATAMRLGVLRSHVEHQSGRDVLTRLEEGVSTAVHRLRTLIFNMRPPSLDESGLVAALNDQLDVIAKDGGFDWEVNASMETEPASEVAANAFRIAQEALMNVTKHAAAQKVTIDVEDHEGGLLVRLRDDGNGFDPDAAAHRRGHIGLASMRERAELAGGWYRIDSHPDAGTTVSYWLPAA